MSKPPPRSERPASGPERGGGLSVEGLSKAYAGVRAVDGVSFDVAPGEAVALLGPNGAGKTTTIECVVGLLSPDQGAVRICGIDARAHPLEAKRRIGVVLQSTGLPDGITPREALAAYEALYGVRGTGEALLAAFGLADLAATPVARLSGGQRQRVALALAFVNDPQVIFLDEPTAGLDTRARRDLHDHIRRAKDEGRAILLTTHDVEEAAELCDRVLVIDHGRIVASGSPRELVGRWGGALRVEARTDGPVEPAWFAGQAEFRDVAGDGQGLTFATADLNAALARLTAILSERGVALTSLNAARGSLEDVILALTEGQA